VIERIQPRRDRIDIYRVFRKQRHPLVQLHNSALHRNYLAQTGERDHRVTTTRFVIAASVAPT
jgi:hypothetical protein